MKKHLCYFLIFVFAFAAFAGCSQIGTPHTGGTLPPLLPSSDPTESTAPTDYLYQPADIPQQYWAVLNNAQKVRFQDGSSLFLDSYTFAEGNEKILYCDNVKYALITTAKNETMLAISYGNDILLLYASGSEIFGNSYTFRTMYQLCTDGTYSWNGTDIDGHHYGENTVGFLDGRITSTTLWQIDNDGQENASYTLGGVTTTKDKMQEYLASRNPTQVSWSKLTRYPVASKPPIGG